MTNILIVRIGPIFDAQRRKLFFYVPLSAEIEHEQVVLEETDEAGLAAVAATLPHGSFACAPELSDVARSMDLPVRELNLDERLLACDVALGLNPPQGVPEPQDKYSRRNFFTALADLIQAPAWPQLAAGSLAQGKATGSIGDDPIRVELTVGMRADPVPTLLFSIAGTGTDHDGDVDLHLANGPEYLVMEMERAYGMACAPRLYLKDGPASTSWNDRWMPVLTSALEALSALGQNRAEIPQNLSDPAGPKVSCDMHLLG